MKSANIYKMRNLFFVLTMFFVFPFISPNSFNLQAQYRNTITGYVFDHQRRPVPQAAVELMNEVYSVIQRTKTDGSGRYFFSGLSAGRFSIKVLPLGTNLDEQTQEIEIVNFVAPGSQTSENAQKDFYLKLRRDYSGEEEITGTVFAQEIPEAAKKAFDKAISDIDNNKKNEGIEGLQKAVQLFPDYYFALEKLGREYIILQKFEEAKQVFIKAVQVNPKGYFGWYGLGVVNYALKYFPESIEAAQKAISINPNSSGAYLLLGLSQRLSKDYSESEKSLLKAMKMAKGKAPDVHWNLALLYYYNLKRFDAAADQLELYIKVYPDNPDTEKIKKLISQIRSKNK